MEKKDISGICNQLFISNFAMIKEQLIWMNEKEDKQQEYSLH